MHYNVLDPEFWDLVRLKNVQTVAEKRIKDIDYSVGYNNEFARRVATNEPWMLVSYGDAPVLYETMYVADQQLFLEEYARVEANVLIPKTIVNARDMALAFLTEAVETGRIYEHNTAELNRHTPFDDTIYLSNLCVAPETEILTDTGHVVIKDVEGQCVNVWNGFEFSRVEVVKTGSNQPLVTVTTDAGESLDCTPYHKFYVQPSYHGKEVEVRAKDLKPGDKLVKFDAPVIEGVEDFPLAYQSGFFSGDGCETKDGSRVYLYGSKQSLLPMFTPSGAVAYQDGRTYFNVAGLRSKFFVPTCQYTVESRLKWFAGLLDSDGYVARNGSSQSLQIVSVEPKFLREVKAMLQTLGIQSKVVRASEGGVQSMPDGCGGLKEYECRPAERLIIGGFGVWQLTQLGLKTHRLVITPRKPQRSALKFVTVVAVEDNGRRADTYCFNEPLRHRGVFNGILTGQCQEIGLPVRGFRTVADLYTYEAAEEGLGEIGLCSLAAIAAGLVDDDEYEDVAYYAALMIDNVIELMEYPFPRLEVTAKARRSIGVGITNLAYAMAKAGLRYSDIEGKRYIARLAERHSYCLHKAALRLAEERGCCEWTDRTKYSRGWLPIDTANREIQAIIGQPLLCDWEGLRKRMLDVGGLRFSVLEAHMPCESSSVAGGHTNGLYPIRAYKVVKTSGTNKNLFIAPELDTLASSYELAWEIPTNDMIDVYAIVQCFTGQAISADLYIKYDKEGKRELSAKTMLQEWLRRVKLGMKTKYYTNSSTGVELDASPKEEEAPVCDSCSL